MSLTVTKPREFVPKNRDPLPDPAPSDVPLTTPSGAAFAREYYVENGLRRIVPYYYTYNTFCKLRWRDQKLLDIFTTEFRDRPTEYYIKALADGKVVVNGKTVPPDYRLKNGEIISHTLHRHEPPVSAQPVGIISEDDGMIVIDKPAGVPVHAAGRYLYNSVVEIMRAERSYSFNPLPCNRLDRLTSGVMFIGRNGQAAENISKKLRERTVRKEYLARVKGRFPDGDENGVTVCEENVINVSPILGLNRVRKEGKNAKTLFKRLAYVPGNKRAQLSCGSQTGNGSTKGTSNELSGSDVEGSAHNPEDTAVESTTPKRAAPPLPSAEDEGYSIVHCLPLTGRTHQIRVHLQFLGHPISNDPIYCNRRVFGDLLGKHDSSPDKDEEIMARLDKMGKNESFADAMQSSESRKPDSDGPAPAAATANFTDTTTPSTEVKEAFDKIVADYAKIKGEKLTGELCPECGTALYSDPGPNELGIYLHAICYRDLPSTEEDPTTTDDTNTPSITLVSPSPTPPATPKHPPKRKSKSKNLPTSDEPLYPQSPLPSSFQKGGWCFKSKVPSWAHPVHLQQNQTSSSPSQNSSSSPQLEREEEEEEPTGITEFQTWKDEWSPGAMMMFDKEKETPFPRRMKGHQ